MARFGRVAVAVCVAVACLSLGAAAQRFQGQAPGPDAQRQQWQQPPQQQRQPQQVPRSPPPPQQMFNPQPGAPRTQAQQFQQQQQRPAYQGQQQQQQQQVQRQRKPQSSLVGALLPDSPLVPPLPFSHVDANHDNVIDEREFATYTAGRIPGAPVVRAQDLIEIKYRKPGDAPGSVPDFNFEDEPVYLFGAAFLNSVAMIIVTELGDKTFFIAAILAMQHPRMIVFVGAIGALAAMTVLSAAIGFALPNLLPRMYTHYAASLLFFYFGLRLLKDARDMDTTQPNEELEEVEQELGMDAKKGDMESGGSVAQLSPKKLTVLTQAFTLTFLAEWGDRSQIATIALASAKDPLGVTLGGVIGHAMCTGLAVVGGRLLATKISERTVAICGGILFLIFAAHSLWAGPDA